PGRSHPQATLARWLGFGARFASWTPTLDPAAGSSRAPGSGVTLAAAKAVGPPGDAVMASGAGRRRPRRGGRGSGAGWSWVLTRPEFTSPRAEIGEADWYGTRLVAVRGTGGEPVGARGWLAGAVVLIAGLAVACTG